MVREEVDCVNTLSACAKTYTHTPKHRPKCTNMEILVYIFVYISTHPTVYSEIKDISTIITTPTLHQRSKESKSAIQNLTFSKLNFYLFENDMMFLF